VPSKLKHLLLTTIEDPGNPKSWSGIPYSLCRSLERQVDCVSIHRCGPPARNPLDIAKRLFYGGTPPRYPLWMTNAALRKNARELRAEIARHNPDAVLAILAQPLVFLKKTTQPVFFFADAAFQSFQDRYRGTIPQTIRTAHYARQEAEVCSHIDGVCLGSEWAVRDGIRVFEAEFPDADFRSRMHVTPLGANWTPDLTREQVLACVASRPADTLQLLYVGVDWLRKGGPLAVEVATEIHRRGHQVHLQIVGCRPDIPAEAAAFTTIHGPLYRTDPAQAKALSDLFLNSHFLLVPTLAECYGIVFAEAQAFALPPVSRAIDALPTVVQDGETGLLLAPAAPASTYVDRILTLRADPAAYTRMATAARDRFESLLNWDKTAEEIVRFISDKLTKSP
jgi:glycosyltransferase involved in cell wall biosynthesis